MCCKNWALGIGAEWSNGHYGNSRLVQVEIIGVPDQLNSGEGGGVPKIKWFRPILLVLDENGNFKKPRVQQSSPPPPPLTPIEMM